MLLYYWPYTGHVTKPYPKSHQSYDLFKYTDIYTVGDTISQHDPKSISAHARSLWCPFNQNVYYQKSVGLQIESPNWQIEMLKSSPMHNSGEATKLSHLVQPAEGTIC